MHRTSRSCDMGVDVSRDNEQRPTAYGKRAHSELQDVSIATSPRAHGERPTIVGSTNGEWPRARHLSHMHTTKVYLLPALSKPLSAISHGLHFQARLGLLCSVASGCSLVRRIFTIVDTGLADTCTASCFSSEACKYAKHIVTASCVKMVCASCSGQRASCMHMVRSVMDLPDCCSAASPCAMSPSPCVWRVETGGKVGERR